MTGISYLWWLLLNIVMTIPVCTDQQCQKFMPSAPYTGSCLLCTCAAAVVAAQWHSMLQFSACCAVAPGCSPLNLKKKPGPAWYWRASQPGRDGEAGCSYWIWLLLEHWQGASNEAIWILVCKWRAGHSGTGQAIRTPEFESNETSYVISYAILHMIWCREPTMCGSKHTILHTMRAYDIYVMTYDVVYSTDIVVSDIVGHDLRCRRCTTSLVMTYDVVRYIGIIRCRRFDLRYRRLARIQMWSQNMLKERLTTPEHTFNSIMARIRIAVENDFAWQHNCV